MGEVMSMLIDLFLFIAEGISGLFGGKGKHDTEESEPEAHPDWIDID